MDTHKRISNMIKSLEELSVLVQHEVHSTEGLMYEVIYEAMQANLEHIFTDFQAVLQIQAVLQSIPKPGSLSERTQPAPHVQPKGFAKTKCTANIYEIGKRPCKYN